MFMGARLRAVLASRMPRLRHGRVSWPVAVAPPVHGPGPSILPRGHIAVEERLRRLLAAIEGLARTRFVELQIAVEPGLSAPSNPAEFDTCVHQLLVAAVARARGAVLVTTMHQAGAVELAILDDGDAGGGATDAMLVAPAGASVVHEHQARCGNAVRLVMPQAPTHAPVQRAAGHFAAAG
jgi:hypothetical protein